MDAVSANPTPGLFIDLQTPASCDGVITAWNVCYFNPTHFNSRETLQNGLPISLQTWRFEAPENGVQTNSYMATVPIPEVPQDFQCDRISVPPSEHMNVAAGDVIGVSVISGAILPVVGNFLLDVPVTPRLTFFHQSDLTQVMRSGDTLLTDNVLHVTAEIVDRGEETRTGAGGGGWSKGVTQKGQLSSLRRFSLAGLKSACGHASISNGAGKKYTTNNRVSEVL